MAGQDSSWNSQRLSFADSHREDPSSPCAEPPNPPTKPPLVPSRCQNHVLGNTEPQNRNPYGQSPVVRRCLGRLLDARTAQRERGGRNLNHLIWYSLTRKRRSVAIPAIGRILRLWANPSEERKSGVRSAGIATFSLGRTSVGRARGKDTNATRQIINSVVNWGHDKD